MRKYIITGLLAWLPLAVTIWVLLQVLAEAPVAVVFHPDAAYSQTPGPGAGARQAHHR